MELYKCEDCLHCIPIGEGDHYCDEVNKIVISEYEPTTDYSNCQE